MTHTEDDINLMLAGLDPTVQDPAPAPGSPRYEAIKTVATTAQPVDIERSKSQWRWSIRVLAVAATVAAAVFGFTLLVPSHGQDAQAAVLAAATATGEVQSLRAELSRDDFQSSTGHATGEFSDGNVRIVETDETGPTETVIIGNRLYENHDGDVSQSTITQKQSLAPYTESAEAVITAALDSSSVQTQGTEDVRGVEAVHYTISLDSAGRKALNALTPSELAWFELEYPDEVAQIDVWVGDGLIQRIVVEAKDGGTATSEFYDFGTPIQIDVPDWAGTN